MLFITQYNHPVVDDYSNSALAAHAWRETGSITQTISAAIEYVKYIYWNIQGSFIGVFFMALQPIVFNESFYMISSIVRILLYAGTTMFFLKIVLMDYFKVDKYTFGIIALAFTLISMQLIISPVDAFYWYTGSMYYIGFHSAALIMFSFILLSLKAEKQSRIIIYTIVSSLLAFIIGAGNYVTALTVVLIIGLMLFYRIAFCRSKWMTPLSCFVFICISLLLSFLAPGNDGRQQFIGERMDPIMAVLSSFRYATLFITTHIKTPVWLLFACITSVIYRAVKNSEYSFRYPGIVTVILYGVYTSTFVPNLYSWVSYGPLRVLNMSFITFLFFLLFSIMYWCGWVSRRINNKTPTSETNRSKITQNFKIVKSAVHVVLSIFLVVGCVMMIFSSFNSVTSVSAAWSIVNSEARVYHLEQLERREVISNPELTNVVLNALTYEPYILFFEDITYYPEDGRNRAMADFYGKESVRKFYDLPIYNVGDTVTFGLAYDEIDSSRRYFVLGLEDWSGHDFTWSNLNAALFRASLDTLIRSDLQLDMTVINYEYNEQYIEQTIELYVNGFYVDKVLLSNGGSDVSNNVTFNISKDFVSGWNFIDLMFEFPDAYHPADVWEDSTDEELRAIGFKSITIANMP